MKQSLGIVCGQINPRNRDIKDPDRLVSVATDKFNSWKHKWVLVLDNYDNPQGFPGLVAFIPNSDFVHVLISSRDPDLYHLGYSLDLGQLSSDEASALLYNRSGVKKTEHNVHQAQAITKRLGVLPLAIELTSAYIRKRKLNSFDGFLDEYENRTKRILQETPKIWHFRNAQSVFTTWDMALQLLGPDMAVRQHKILFLTMCASLDFSSISEYLFKAPKIGDMELFESHGAEWRQLFLDPDGNWDSDQFLDMLTELKSSSLIESFSYDNTAHLSSFVLHPLVADWLRIRSDSVWNQALLNAAFAIELLLRNSGTSIGRRTIFPLPPEERVRTMSHIKALRSHMARSGSSNAQINLVLGNPPLQDAGEIFSAFLMECEVSSDALDIGQRVLLYRQGHLGENHPRTLDIRCLIGLILSRGHSNKSDYRAVADLFKDIAEAWENIFGPHHKKTLFARLNALLYESEFDPTPRVLRQRYEAAQLILTAQDISSAERLLACTDAAYCLIELNRYSEAESILDSIQTVEFEFEQYTHFEGMLVRALLLQMAGRLTESCAFLKRIVAWFEYNWGCHDYSTYRGKVYLARSLQAMGKPTDLRAAESIMREVMASCTSAYPMYFVYLRDLSEILVDQGRYAEAEETINLHFPIMQAREISDSLPIESITLINALINAVSNQGGYSRPAKLRRLVYDTASRLYGPTDKQTLHYQSLLTRFEAAATLGFWKCRCHQARLEHLNDFHLAIVRKAWEGAHSMENVEISWLLSITSQHGSMLNNVGHGKLGARWKLFVAWKCIERMQPHHRLDCDCLTGLAEYLHDCFFDEHGAEALVLLNAVRLFRQRVLGIDHPHVVRMQIQVASNMFTARVDHCTDIRPALELVSQAKSFYAHHYTAPTALSLDCDWMEAIMEFWLFWQDPTKATEAVRKLRRALDTSKNVCGEDSWPVLERKRMLAIILESQPQYVTNPGESEILIEECNIYDAMNRARSEKGPWCECEEVLDHSLTGLQGASRRESNYKSCEIDLGFIHTNVPADICPEEGDWENISDEVFTLRLQSFVDQVISVLEDDLRALQPTDQTAGFNPSIRTSTIMETAM